MQTELNSGNFVGSWGPEITPYGIAIARRYLNQVPLYMTIPTKLTGVARQESNVISDPYQYDSLIVGAHISMGTEFNGDNGQQIFLQVEDLRSGYLWSAPGQVGTSPCTAYGGSRSAAMPILVLPEAYFLPAGVSLRHSFSVISSTATGGSLTWIGIQLINPFQSGAPETIIMPDGKETRVGSRLPWLATIGLGTEISVIGSLRYVLASGSIYTQYTPPIDCDLEIHDIEANWFTQGDIDQLPANVLISIADKGQPDFWSPSRSPAPSLMADFSKAYPSLPFTKPYRLKAGHRLAITIQNTNELDINDAYITVRGVRMCK
jgi:hypothetical protein